MAHRGPRMFSLKEHEIQEYLVAENSDTEDALVLDDEDQDFIEQDLESGAHESIIEPASNSSISTRQVQNEPVCIENTPNLENEVTFTWKQNSYRPYIYSETDYQFEKINVLQDVESPKPLEIFEAVTDVKKLIENLIIPESIRYAHQKGVVFTVSPQEMCAFIGMNYVMGYHVLPTIRSYWSTEADMGVPYIAQVMPLTRFEDIRRNLHFCNNESQPSQNSPDFDRAYKIRNVINHFNTSFQYALNNTSTQSVDEHMVKFKGQNIMKQYMQNKPVKRGFKLWCRADAKTGYLFECDIYTGKKKSGPEVGLGESVVLELTKSLVGLGCEVYFDNFFTSTSLQYKLAKMNIKACGTVRTNRKNLPKNLPSDKEMKRGDIYSCSFEGISFVKWMDNKAVHLLTNFVSPIPTKMVKRRIVGSAQKLDVKCPEIVCRYNTGMGGVDLMDQRKVTYEVDRKSKIKYYLRLFFDLLDIAMNNAYTVYEKLYKANRIEGVLLTSLEFRQVVARGLINDFTSRKHALPTTSMTRKRIINQTSQKRSGPAHAMVKVAKRKRCVQCAKSGVENRTDNICELCNVHLCYTTTRNCFADFNHNL